MSRTFLFILFAFMNLTACATATRGTTTLLIVNTTPSGAHVTSTHKVKKQRAKRKTAKKDLGAKLAPQYQNCAPTPCGIEVSRKANFEILVRKDGYMSQVQFIDKTHRKDVAKRTAAKTAGGTAVAAGGTVAVASATGGATIAGTSMLGPLAIAAAIPILAVGGTSMLIDASPGANYDLTPNPVDMSLEKRPQDNGLKDQVASGFFERRQQKELGNTPTTTK